MISLPPAFTERMQQLLGNESETFFQALVSESPTSIRLNPEKTANTDLPFSELLSRQVPWCSNGYYLKERPSFTSDPLLHGGAYYVQEASSMFLQVVLQQISGDTPLRVLDLCAAPGGQIHVTGKQSAQGFTTGFQRSNQIKSLHSQRKYY